jgi:ribosome-binding factor A
MADAARARKIADRIKEVVAANLEHLVKDPDLGFVTVTDVRVTNDLQHATLFYTVLGEEDQRARTAALLERHKGKRRSFVGKQIGIRLTPTLEFIADAIPETAAHLDELLKEARQRDAATAARAASAKYAGEPDPYRKPEPGEADGEAGGALDGAVHDGTVSGGSAAHADVEERDRAANRGR